MDTEPFWHATERSVLSSLGITISPEDSAKTSGFRCSEVIEYWAKRSGKLHEIDVAETEQMIEDKIVELIESKGLAKPGAVSAFRKAQTSPSIKVGVVSSSPLRVIEAGLKKLGLQIDREAIFSAIDEQFGKPHPSVYLTFCKWAEIEGFNGLAFEDSLNGSIAAKAAKMNLVSIPEGTSDRKRFGLADLVLGSLEEFELSL
jgi:mannitol-1-/sugar-/sorbitol-6-/2-deoxyglucose-6-phosphatase